MRKTWLREATLLNEAQAVVLDWLVPFSFLWKWPLPKIPLSSDFVISYFWFLIVIKHTEHKIVHLNHAWVYSCATRPQDVFLLINHRLPSPWNPPFYFLSLQTWLLWGPLLKWDHTVLVFSWLACFTEHHVLKAKQDSCVFTYCIQCVCPSIGGGLDDCLPLNV